MCSCLCVLQRSRGTTMSFSIEKPILATLMRFGKICSWILTHLPRHMELMFFNVENHTASVLVCACISSHRLCICKSFQLHWLVRSLLHKFVMFISTSSLLSFQDWWSDLLQEKNHKEVEHGGKMVLLLDILTMSSNVGDKTLVFSQSLSTLDMIEHFLSKLPRKGKIGKCWRRGKDWYRYVFYSKDSRNLSSK